MNRDGTRLKELRTRYTVFQLSSGSKWQEEYFTMPAHGSGQPVPNSMSVFHSGRCPVGDGRSMWLDRSIQPLSVPSERTAWRHRTVRDAVKTRPSASQSLAADVASTASQCYSQTICLCSPQRTGNGVGCVCTSVRQRQYIPMGCTLKLRCTLKTTPA